MRRTRGAPVVALAFVLALAGCESLPTPVMPADENDPAIYAPDPAPIESPPLEPVEPPLSAPTATPLAPPDSTSNVNAATAQSTPPPQVIVVASPPAPPTEDEEMIALLADLQRFGTLQGDELKRELTTALATFSRQRTDINRVRVAVLYTLVRQSPQDDQRALQLFENVAKNAAPTSPVRHLAAVLQTQVIERQRAVHDEQQKADAAIQKLEALRAMERSLLRDRVRSGGGGGASGSGGSGR